MAEAASSSAIKVDLSILNQQNIYSGNYLQAQVTLKNTLESSIGPLFGTLSLEGNLVSFTNLPWNSSVVRRLSITPAMGGGTVAFPKAAQAKGNSSILKILWCPATVISTDCPLDGRQVIDYRWTLRLPRELPPSYEGSKVAIRYDIILELKVKGQSDTFLCKSVQIFPYFFHQVNEQASSEPKSPFTRYIFEDGPLIIRENQIYLENISGSSAEQAPETVLDRFTDRGIIPALVDLCVYKRRPSQFLPTRLQDPGQYFSEFVLCGIHKPISFVLNLPNGRSLGSIHINRELLRAGEQLHCHMKLNSHRSVQLFQMVAQLVARECVEGLGTRGGNQSSFESVYRRFEAAIWMHRQTSFSISIPVDAPCSLYSDVLSLEWNLCIALFGGGKLEEDAKSDDEKEDEKEGKVDGKKEGEKDGERVHHNKVIHNEETLNKTIEGHQVLQVTPVDTDSQRLTIKCDIPIRVIPTT